MKYRLRSYEINPPGGFCYGPITAPLIEAVARQLQSRRVGNHKPRTSYPECLEDVDIFMANTVLKGDPTYTLEIQDGDPITFPLQQNAPGLVPCRGCGIPVPATS